MVVLGLATPHHDSTIADTFAQQLGWVFVGPCHPSAHGPPAKLRSFTLFRWFTHTPRSSGAFEGSDKRDEGEDER